MQNGYVEARNSCLRQARLVAEVQELMHRLQVVAKTKERVQHVHRKDPGLWSGLLWVSVQRGVHCERNCHQARKQMIQVQSEILAKGDAPRPAFRHLGRT